MPFEFKFPDVGEGIHEGTIVKWHVKIGDKVKEDQQIVSVETDKAVVEIPSPKTGTILKINFKEGEIIKVGQVLVVIGESKEVSSKPEKKEVKQETKERKSVSVVGDLEEAPEEEQEIKQEKLILKESPNKTKVFATLKVRKLAKDKNIDITQVSGTGPEGRITEKDLSSTQSSEIVPKISGIKSVRKYDFYGYVDRILLAGVRKVIAERMVNSVKKIPHVSHMDFADVTKLAEIRTREKEKLEKENIKLTFMPFIIKAVIESLKEHPLLNSTLDEENNEIVIKKYYNIGFAVDTEAGLMVPVIKIADSKKIIDLAKDIENLANLAKDRKIDLGDLKGGTFTITNIGSLGGMYATPIINYPESAILALGRIQDSVLAVNNEIKIRKILPFTVTFDHRILDGAEAARFANKLKEILENPEELIFS
ncbi:2-oxo acid dehydrogenase subunit E2 [Candidatus Woesearchaeota archaeon]|nr:2-oxo acid dehydrogenase subunit E2 [Candidatus Woesearchaeota archaeon]